MDNKNSYKNRISEVPKKPGVYLHSDINKNVIYVGKAISLNDRLKFYFSDPKDVTPKVSELISKIDDFDYIVTDSEQEALLLENQLIKKYQPKYNARLKDDKSYPYIKITKSEKFPKVLLTRNPNIKDKNKYFGPYTSVSSVRQTLDLLSKIFPYRTCDKKIEDNSRPCFNLEIGRCSEAYHNNNKTIYDKTISNVEKFLSGKTKSIVKKIKKDMEVASDEQNYERAAVLRDRINAIEKMLERQKVSGIKNETFDLISCFKIKNEGMIIVFNIIQGSLLAHEKFRIENVEGTETNELLRLFMFDYYSKNINIPNKIYVSNLPNEDEVIKKILQSKTKKKISIIIPRRGSKKSILEMATKNAIESIKQWQVKWINDTKKTQKALIELQQEIGLDNIPKRIECYDISHIQGSNVVASMSVFENGVPKKSDYRRFKISEDKNDDFEAMREVISRRFNRLINKEKAIDRKIDSFNKRPDLVLIDGGKGQLSSALQSMNKLGISNIPIAGIAKKEEELFLPFSEESITLDKSSQGLYLIQRIRDEAHRFAITYHRNLRQKKSNKSKLDIIEGIGLKRRKALISHFKSVEKIKKSSVEEISKIKNINKTLAEQILRELNSK
ncbi:MAG: excinuclease ABC subunit UvrC [Chloroflexota bacterium]|nr:excinuclease ABC subunit UvrC [Chloroflexota bacterium]